MTVLVCNKCSIKRTGKSIPIGSGMYTAPCYLCETVQIIKYARIMIKIELPDACEILDKKEVELIDI